MRFETLRKNIKGYLKNKEDDKLFNNCFLNTIDTALTYDKDGSVFIVTGDIPAMWLRDSAASVLQYVPFCEDDEVKTLIKGVIKKQLQQICHDPYANAFMHDNTTTSEWINTDKTNVMFDDIWERKFELDSLCYPFFLMAKYYEKTKDISIFNQEFIKAFDVLIDVIIKERNHSGKSNYYFYRKRDNRVINDIKIKTDSNEEKGLVWSAFRPSDDECKYHYHIPDNMFLVSILYKMSGIFKKLEDIKRLEICESLTNELRTLIDKYGIINVEHYGKIYVSETNCLGNYETNDDANIPSLLSLPYLEYPFLDKDIYINTRRYILSTNNKYYFKGKILEGIGSPHTPGNKVWPLAIAMQGITSIDETEIKHCYKMLKESAEGYMVMHESVNVNNINEYTRAWFAWANSLFSYFVILKKDIIEK